MRRIPASVLLLLFSYTLITPLLFAEPESKIAACCRRDGKHHCAKMAQMAHAAEAGDTVRITNSKTCPLFPPGASAPVTGDVAVPAPNPVFIIAVEAIPAPAEQVEIHRRIAAARAWLKRGPPSLLA
jgi:hypothetical protein